MSYIGYFSDNIPPVEDIDLSDTTEPEYPLVPEETPSDGTIKDIEKEVEATLKSLEVMNFDLVGTESLTNGIVRLLAGIINTFVHIFNTFKTNTFKFYKNLKRTELVYFHESNVVSAKRIFEFDYQSLRDLQVPIAKNMGTSYLEVTSKAIATLEALNMKTRISAFCKRMKLLRDSVLGSGDVYDLTETETTDLPNVTSSFKEFDKCMKGKFQREVPFGSVISSSEEFKQVNKLLLDSSKYQYEVASVYSDMETATTYLNDVLHFVEKQTGIITKSNLMMLSQMTLFYAKLFDMYGVVIQDLTRIEHNFVTTLGVVRKTYNL